MIKGKSNPHGGGGGEEERGRGCRDSLARHLAFVEKCLRGDVDVVNYKESLITTHEMERLSFFVYLAFVHAVSARLSGAWEAKRMS